MEYLGANKFVRQSCMLPHDIMHSMYNFPDIFHHIWTGPPGELEKYWMRNLDLASDLGIQPCVAWQNICVKLFFLNYILPKNVGLLSIICIYVYIYICVHIYIYIFVYMSTYESVYSFCWASNIISGLQASCASNLSQLQSCDHMVFLFKVIFTPQYF